MLGTRSSRRIARGDPTGTKRRGSGTASLAPRSQPPGRGYVNVGHTSTPTRRQTCNEPGSWTRARVRGRYWVRTSDLFGVNEARYHCANHPRRTRDLNPCIRLFLPLPRLSATPQRSRISPKASTGFERFQGSGAGIVGAAAPATRRHSPHLCATVPRRPNNQSSSEPASTPSGRPKPKILPRIAPSQSQSVELTGFGPA